MPDRVPPAARERRADRCLPRANEMPWLPGALMPLVLCSAILGLGPCSSARAAAGKPPAGPSYIVEPDAGQPAAEIGRGYFTVTLKPGQSQTFRIAIKNVGSEPLGVYNYAADGMAMSAGGIGYATRLAPAKLVGTWLSMNPGRLTLAPGEASRVTATVRVPESTGAGQYVGGVAFEDQRVEHQHMSGAIAIDVHYRQLIAVEVTVPGAQIIGAKVTGVDLHQLGSGSYATVMVQSTGNMLWKGYGTLQVGNGRQSMSTPFEIGTLLPGVRAAVQVPLASVALLPGAYDIAVHAAGALGGGPIGWQGLVSVTSVASRNAYGTPIPTIVLQPHSQPTAVAAVISPKGAAHRLPALLWLAIAAGSMALLLGILGLSRSMRRELGMASAPEFTQHARDQMALRGVAQAEVKQVLADRAVLYADQYGNPCYVRLIAGRRIRVVVAAGSDPPRVVTVVGQVPEAARASAYAPSTQASAGYPRIAHDRAADAVYITLRDVPCIGGHDLDDGRRIDVGPNQQPRGIELLNVSHGVRTAGLPDAAMVADLLRAHALATVGSSTV